METYSILPGESFTIHRDRDFYSCDSIISLKAINLSVTERDRGKRYSFLVYYKHPQRPCVSFEIILEYPNFLASETMGIENGPFNIIEVKSNLENKIPIVLQVNFTDKLGKHRDHFERFI